MKTVISIAIIINLGIFCSYAQDNSPIILGILETHSNNWPCKNISTSSYFSFIRLLFLKTSEKWIPIDVIKSERKILDFENNKFHEIDNKYYKMIYTKYFILYDMKNIGYVNAIESNKYKDENSWRSVITIQQDNVIHVGKPSNQYSEDWCGDVSYRPLVVSNYANYHDPMNWKPTKIDNIKLINKCKSKFDIILRKEFTYEVYDKEPIPSGNIVYIQAFISKNNHILLQLFLISKEKLIYNNNLLSKWFYITNNEIRYIGSYKNLIDAADYDNDGSSDLLFFETGIYNSSGYTLLYNNLKNKCRFYYGSH